MNVPLVTIHTNIFHYRKLVGTQGVVSKRKDFCLGYYMY